MPWSTSTINSEINNATDGYSLNEPSLVHNFKISDAVRSKEVNSKIVLQAIRKKIYDPDQSTQILALHLLDTLVKNGGQHFFVEFSNKEFIDAYVAELLTLQNQKRNLDALNLMLDYFQAWAIASQGMEQAKYLKDKYEELKRRKDLNFPTVDSSKLSSTFIESETAPEWVDSDRCMLSGQLFTFYNRKHHCRNCGGVFLQEYCSKMAPIYKFGIDYPVRVCDTCYDKLVKRNDHSNSDKATGGKQKVKGVKAVSNNSDMKNKMNDREMNDLMEAVKLSLAESQPQRRTSQNSKSEKVNFTNQNDHDYNLQKARNPQNVQNKPITSPVEEQDPSKSFIETFHNTVLSAKPEQVLFNPEIGNMNSKAMELQPKIVSELRSSSDKLKIFEELNSKLLAVVGYYDQLLEMQLNPNVDLPKQVTVDGIVNSNKQGVIHGYDALSQTNVANPQNVSNLPQYAESFQIPVTDRPLQKPEVPHQLYPDAQVSHIPQVEQLSQHPDIPETPVSIEESRNYQDIQTNNFVNMSHFRNTEPLQPPTLSQYVPNSVQEPTNANFANQQYITQPRAARQVQPSPTSLSEISNASPQNLQSAAPQAVPYIQASNTSPVYTPSGQQLHDSQSPVDIPTRTVPIYSNETISSELNQGKNEEIPPYVQNGSLNSSQQIAPISNDSPVESQHSDQIYKTSQNLEGIANTPEEPQLKFSSSEDYDNAATQPMIVRHDESEEEHDLQPEFAPESDEEEEEEEEEEETEEEGPALIEL